MRLRALIATLACTIALCTGASTPAAKANAAPAAFQLPLSLDLHDGQITQSGSTYIAVGTEYHCGFTYQTPGTPWCGFGISTAPSPAGPWTTPTLLFSPTAIDSWNGKTWQAECGSNGHGCFNPRLIQRLGWGSNDGVWILYFNTSNDTPANGYYFMGCNPAGTSTVPTDCGYTAPHGTMGKPSLHICDTYGDFGFVASGTGSPPAMVCTENSQTGLNIEQMTPNAVAGTGAGQTDLAGLNSVEGPGGWYDTASGRYILTYSDTSCAYCAATGTGYATATAITGPYTAPADASAGSITPPARRLITATSCGGQPRTVSIIDGQPYQGVDLWTGAPNETSAGNLFSPLTYLPTTAHAGDGGIWQPEVTYPC